MGDRQDRIGAYITSTAAGESFHAYIPPPLPPTPPIELDNLYPLIDQATQALGRLDGITSLLPDTDLFLYLYVRKEALLSSQIEGTQSSFSDLLLYESEQVPGVPLDDVREVSNYVAAMTHGLERMREGFPLSLRLLREIHAILLQDGRGANLEPGEFRRSQNWIGGTRPGNATYVPPPPEKLMECLGALETFLHDDGVKLPVLVKAALAHVQFETIHPFLDGNGRLGRLLVTFLLCADGVLKEPILYLSLYLKSNRNAYYDFLQRVREAGAWETWLEFFLEGVTQTATQATDAATQILALFEKDRGRIGELGRAASSVLRIHEYLQKHAVLSVPVAAKAISISAPTVRKSAKHLQELGILHETTGRRRDRLYVYQEYLAILSEGTEPIRTG
ncbi:MAG: Fic family protein [Rhodospirillales bacterium]|nr:Fic family protein [Rhodospirillales bacterium]